MMHKHMHYKQLYYLHLFKKMKCGGGGGGRQNKVIIEAIQKKNL